MEVVGDLSELPKEVIFEWKFRDIFSMSEKINYISPKFYFCGATWFLEIIPNDYTEDESICSGLYLNRKTFGTPSSVSYRCGIKKVEENREMVQYFKTEFVEELFTGGCKQLIQKITLMDMKSQLVSENELMIVFVQLKSSKPSLASFSSFNRLLEVSDNLLEILLSDIRSDVKLGLTQITLPAHRMILETRSPYFKAVLKKDSKGKQEDKLYIRDVDDRIMANVLMYLYTGDMCEITPEVAIPYYVAANKFEIKPIKELCCEFILRNLSVDWVCDVIEFADAYQENEVRQHAIEFCKENAVEILESEKWKSLSNKNPNLRSELLAYIVKGMLSIKDNPDKGESSITEKIATMRLTKSKS